MATDAPFTSFLGVHHLKIPASDINRTMEFYTSVLPFQKRPQYNHIDASGNLFAVIMEYEPSHLALEIRKNNAQSDAQEGWDPIVWTVNLRADLEDWVKWFDKHEVEHSKIFTGFNGWFLCAKDPDGRIVKLYTKEDHAWTTDLDKGKVQKYGDECDC
jgi:catechol-2,3-dioxygenase